MSVEVCLADGIFTVDDFPCKATAIKAVVEMHDFDDKDNWFKAWKVFDALNNKHPEYKWFTMCHTDGIDGTG